MNPFMTGLLLLKTHEMKKLIPVIIIALLINTSALALQHTITNNGNTFGPADITVNIGDTINFTLGNMHNAIEVSQATYNANGSNSNGGFSLDFGGGQIVMNTPGTFYYVCAPHASFGMKGIIRVGSASIARNIPADFKLNVSPNPASDQLTIEYFLPVSSNVSISLINVTGARVAEIFSGYETTGDLKVNFSLRDEKIKSGIYMISIQTGEAVAVRRIIVR